MNRHLAHRLVVLAGFAAATALSVQLATQGARARHAAALAEAADLTALRDRLSGQLALLQSGGTMPDLPPDAVWQQQDRTATELAMQQAILAHAETAGLTLTAFGPAAPPAATRAPSVGFQIEASATWPQMLAFLVAAGQSAPALAVSDLAMRAGPATAGSGEAQLSIRAQLWGLAPGTAGAP